MTIHLLQLFLSHGVMEIEEEEDEVKRKYTHRHRYGGIDAYRYGDEAREVDILHQTDMQIGRQIHFTTLHTSHTTLYYNQ